MLRHNVPVRRDLDQIAANNGFDFHIIDNEIYWDESRAYRFTLRQIEEQIEKPTAELHQMCLEVVDRAVKDEEILTQLAIPPLYWDVIAESWRARDPSLYGRMDFAWCGNAPVKLLEYNADTPTSLYESAYFQWLWLEDARRSGISPLLLKILFHNGSTHCSRRLRSSGPLSSRIIHSSGYSLNARWMTLSSRSVSTPPTPKPRSSM